MREHDDRELSIRVLEDRVGESGALTVMPQLWLAIHRRDEPAVAVAALLPGREHGRRPRALHRGAIDERGVVERSAPLRHVDHGGIDPAVAECGARGALIGALE